MDNVKLSDYEILNRIYCGTGMQSVGIIKVRNKENNKQYYVIGISIPELQIEANTKNILMTGKWFEEKEFLDLL